MSTITELKYVVAKETANRRKAPQKFFFGGQRPALRPKGVSNGSAFAGLLDFHLPPELEAGEPPEARGLARDEVRLMVSYRSNNCIEHAQFRDLPSYLAAGDLLVINTSGTLNAALRAIRSDGTPLELHLSTHLPADLWAVEVRQPDGTTTQPFHHATAGETLTLPAGASVKLHTPYRPDHRDGSPTRLWIATLHLPDSLSLGTYLGEYGFPFATAMSSEPGPVRLTKPSTLRSRAAPKCLRLGGPLPRS